MPSPCQLSGLYFLSESLSGVVRPCISAVEILNLLMGNVENFSYPLSYMSHTAESIGF